MVKKLLEDRFKLKWHLETRELPVYALVVARDDGKLGEKLKPSTADCSAADAEMRKRLEAPSCRPVQSAASAEKDRPWRR
jgi:uncharacterized protein (TIGR03435 family)